LAGAFVRDTQARIAQAEAVDRLHTLVRQSQGGTLPVADWSGELQERARAARAAQAPALAERERARDTVQRIVGRLECALGADEERNINTLCSALLGCADAARAEGLATELRLRVQRANERAARAKADAAAAVELVQHLRGLEGDDVTGVLTEVQCVIDGTVPLRNELRERVDAVQRAAEKRADDAYVSQVLREELTRLGYETGPEFATLFTGGGEAIVRRPEQPEYGVEVGVDAARGTFELSVVRFAEAAAEDGADRAFVDKSAEERWCKDHDELSAALIARGVKRRTIRQLPPGAQAVRIVRAARDGTPRRVRRDGALQREL
ncbi:MAG: hypothetical protein QOD51_2588, partial [Candidatus Eremiobacteraeota bacterium]|nr:hypothetical protein [Candidatus Eremiobacteraeota bacterium]